MDDLELARRAALAGADVALRYARALADLPKELKADGSVVTAADRAVEAAIREVLTGSRPGDAILGEEGGQTGDGGRRWIIDPIDGTALFVAGDDRWLVLIALEEAGEIVAAVAAVPAQGVSFWAVRGAGAYTDSSGLGPGRRITVDADGPGGLGAGRGIAVDPGGSGGLGAGRGIAVDPGGSGGLGAGRGIAVDPDGPDTVAGSRLGVLPAVTGLVEPLLAVTPALPWALHPGLLVARGELDLAVQTGGQIWDFAATSLIVTEAGGSFSGVAGDTRPGAGPSVYARSEKLRLDALNVLAP